MGMYTEIYVNVDLNSDTPDDVIDIIKYVVSGDLEYFRENDRFPTRWGLLSNSGSYYTPNTSYGELHEEGDGELSLLLKGDIKNYEDEIDKFFRFIHPYVDAVGDEMIGYSRYEEDMLPVLYMKDVESPKRLDTNNMEYI